MSWRAFRQGLLKVHLWVALILCVPLVLIGLTGSALLAQRELLLLTVPIASVSGDSQSLARIVAAAEAAASPGQTALRVKLPEWPGRPAWVRFAGPGAETPEVDFYVDSVSLDVLGRSDVVERGPILAFLITIHAFLALPPHIGLPFVGAMGGVFIFLGLSGLVLWWPRKGAWRQAFWVRRGARGLRLHLDLHRAAGIWGVFVLIIVSISGIYLSFPEAIGPYMRRLMPGEAQFADPPRLAGMQVGPIGPDQAVTIAQAAIANARVTGLQLGRPGRPFAIEMAAQGMSPSAPPVLLTIDSETAEITYVDDPRTYNFRDRLLNWQHLLHFGIGLGLVWKILVFLSGLLPLVLAVTGVTIWWKKRRATRQTKIRKATEEEAV